MNCKPNELAFVVRSRNGNEGKLVTTVRWIGEYTFLGGASRSDTWLCRCEQDMATLCGQHWRKGELHHISDSHLRPIRPGDISDEEVRDLYAPKVPEAA
jgi:hypothetical protein